MRKIININEGWKFTKSGTTQVVNLPHTWNGIDGQGQAEAGKYYRGQCIYARTVPSYEGKVYIEINGANTLCTVNVNGTNVCTHDNGYAMFRAEITPYLTGDENVLEIYVDNSPSELLYPETADFTFYGGIYRDVNIICEVGEGHYALTDKSRTGLYITPKTDGTVYIKSNLEGCCEGLTKVYEILDAQGKVVATSTTDALQGAVMMKVSEPQLWNGRKNPYLYTLSAKLTDGDKTVDAVCDRFGFRTVSFDSEKGCFLNGEHIKLQGVSRHQDREDIGNALTIKEHREDVDLILELGANSVRLAHYQQDEKFYSLCDEGGLLVWAEIPVISRYVKKKQPQAKRMMEELIRQNYNHPSIFCWGIENEISIGSTSPSLISGIKELNDIAHRLDPTRPTTAAQLAMCPNNSKLNSIPDILGYNHYFGWYFQKAKALDEWLDEFHREKPEIKLCLSEYGAEGITTLHTDDPQQGDYTEEYQALLHEHYIKAINERDWLWGSYVWNMFDFGSAIRNEGGVKGRNNKGLITIDRKIKKDAYYVYKAYWCEDKFVHIAGPRFIDRKTGEQQIKVYSNCEKVALTVNGEKQETTADKVFIFNVTLREGENTVIAEGENCSDTLTLNGTDVHNTSYDLPEGAVSFVRNWFDTDGGLSPDRLSLEDSIGDILATDEVRKILKANANVEIPEKAISALKHIGVKHISHIAEKTKAGKKYVSLANQFLQTIEK